MDEEDLVCELERVVKLLMGCRFIRLDSLHCSGLADLKLYQNKPAAPLIVDLQAGLKESEELIEILKQKALELEGRLELQESESCQFSTDVLEILQAVFASYSQDVEMKKKIVHDIAKRNPDEHEVSLYADAWQLHPYIGHERKSTTNEKSERGKVKEKLKTVLSGLTSGEHGVTACRLLVSEFFK
eukprot:m.24645 g.24645  ORF g.24645 m.24645 type:complete len:186 (+) comp28662_c0_seq1:170-727(+)